MTTWTCFYGFDKKSAAMHAKKSASNNSGNAIKSEIMSKQQLAEELCKSIIKKCRQPKVSSCF